MVPPLNARLPLLVHLATVGPLALLLLCPTNSAHQIIATCKEERLTTLACDRRHQPVLAIDTKKCQLDN